MSSAEEAKSKVKTRVYTSLLYSTEASKGLAEPGNGATVEEGGKVEGFMGRETKG